MRNPPKGQGFHVARISQVSRTEREGAGYRPSFTVLFIRAMSQTTSPRRTSLAPCHTALGAHFIDFGGWEMPAHYGSQIEEHHAVRNDAGMFDVSHMCVVDVEGKNAKPFLRTVFANDVDKLKTPGKALYTCMLNEQGGILDDLIIYYFSDDSFRLVVNAATAESDLVWLESQNRALGTAVTLTPRRIDNAPAPGQALGIIAVQGPNARNKTWAAIPGSQAASESTKPFNTVQMTDPELGEIMIARTGYTGEDGFELMLDADKAALLWNRLVEAGVQPAGLGCRDTLRLEAGMNLYGQDMDATTSPLDAGLGWTVALDADRNFIGKQALQAQGQQHALVGLDALERGGIFRAHQAVQVGQGLGEVTSGTFSPTMQKTIAIARVPCGVEAGIEALVSVRGKQVPARVVSLPFVRHGKQVCDA